MTDAHGAVENAIRDVERLRRRLKNSKTRQVRSREEKNLIKATCFAWFRNHRRTLIHVLGEGLFRDVDDAYKQLLAAADRSTSRQRYGQLLKDVRQQLSAIREYAVAPPPNVDASADEPPDFTPLVPDPTMRDILSRRWLECARCLSAGAPLAATVMMGSLLEALLVARFHRESDKKRVFKAVYAPKAPKTGKTLPLHKWTLRHYIDVAHGLGWISRSAKDLGEVVRDYRNYIHPYKEHTHGVHLSDEDASLFWEVTKGIARQLIGSTSV